MSDLLATSVTLRRCKLVRVDPDGSVAEYIFDQQQIDIGGMDDNDLKRQHESFSADWGEMAGRVAEGALLCTPDRAVDRIMEYVAAGADEINIALRAPWNEEALDVYLTDIMPKVRAAVG